jgi:class 3 adenylate cyclase
MVDGKRLNRTWLCSVLFSDLVNYSSQSVDTQSEWKAFFNRSVANAIKSVVVEDRVIIDTGDGAAICFLGDPESAVLCSLAILNDFKEREQSGGNTPRIRLGVHLGPVKLVQDLNGNLNAIGDGINVGQRIMSFADGDQILVSRSYFEVVSRLSDEYCRLFKFEGMRQDKHVREHAVYALVPQLNNNLPLQGITASPEDIAVQAVTKEEALSSFDQISLDIVEDCLRESVGPLALHLVRIESAKVKTLRELCEVLAEKAVPVNEREKFLKTCRTRLQKINPQAEIQVAETGSLVEHSQPGASRSWDEAFLQDLRLQLSEYLGPVASVVVDRAARKAKTREELLATLVEYFPTNLK